MPTNRQIVLDNRPAGAAGPENFRLQEVTLDLPAPGQVQVRNHFLSLDPYMRGRMNEGKSYVAPQPLGEVMGGSTVGQVTHSAFDGLQPGDWVVGPGGWQEWSVSSGKLWRKIQPDAVPLTHYLGAVGMPGVTAWVGLTQIMKPRAGDTVVISAATGAVGSAFVALAKARDLRVIGVAGGPAKCAYAVRELGFDACIDYQAHADAQSLSNAIAGHCPDGVEAYFENVGGMVLNAVLPLLNDHARIALCGMVAGYDGQAIPLAQPLLLLMRRILLQAFIVSEHPECWPPALQELEGLARSGALLPRETVSHGLETAPEAFLGMLKGRNFGKQLVRLVD